jgi:predicted transcriptional regulator
MSQPKSPPAHFTVRVTDDLAQQVDAAAKKTRLSKTAVTRLALNRGLPVLLAQLEAATPAAR